MSKKNELLTLINRDIPKNVDWKLGATKYVANYFDKFGKENIERYTMNKPFSAVGSEDPEPAIVECSHYMSNFSNALSILKPRLGARILDVACGGGWVSSYLSKMGYWTYGIDISADFIELATKRLAMDQAVKLSLEDASKRFSVCDIESEPLPPSLHGSFDIVWLESCLHHFLDPVSALSNLGDGLKPDGVIVLMEFENRNGAIKTEYMKVMEEYNTLERPYSRSELESILNLAGISEYEFLGVANGWHSPRNPATHRLGEAVVEMAGQLNLAICAKEPKRLDQLFPHRLVKDSILLGRGFHELANGFRWCSPYAEFIASCKVPQLELEIFSPLPDQLNREQTIVAYGDKGELGRLTLNPTKQQGLLTLRNIQKDEKVYLYSLEAFRPSQSGSDDTRLLSYYIKDSF